jgi:hypothetical protein
VSSVGSARIEHPKLEQEGNQQEKREVDSGGALLGHPERPNSVTIIQPTSATAPTKPNPASAQASALASNQSRTT